MNKTAFQLIAALFVVILAGVGCKEQSSAGVQSEVLELDNPDPASPSVDEVTFSQIADNVWVHSSYRDMEVWGLVLSNGLIIVDADEALLVDTAWDNLQTNQILDWVEDSLGVALSGAVFTHAHDDKMGGVAAIRDRNIPTYAYSETNRIAIQKSLTPAEIDLDLVEGQVVSFLAGTSVLFPGGGHTIDNIVVAHEGSGVLFGGCLVRPGGTESLGNTAEASMQTWASAIEVTGRVYPWAEIVVPSHGPPADRALLDLTKRLTVEADADADVNADADAGTSGS